ncbi:MAG TPA: hypothetical protein VHE55_11845 [Fimbriimonadaceae bacterium]|nr:hypothetical protein [Fimbriimonadaceae bacterium]
MNLSRILQIAAILLAARAYGGQEPNRFDHTIRAAKTSYETELLIRNEVGKGNLDQLLDAYDRAYAKTHEPVFLYGFMRTREIAWSFDNYYSIGIRVPRFIHGGIKRDKQIVERVPVECKNDAYALAAYYQWLMWFRESGMPKPKEKTEKQTITVNGRKETMIVHTKVSDPWQDKRFDEIFHEAWKLDPHNPMVLYIASWRVKGEAQYNYLKQAYDAGGKLLMPERLLDSIVDQAKKLGKTADVKKYSALLDAWQAANKGNLWGRIYEFDVDYARKHAVKE